MRRTVEVSDGPKDVHLMLDFKEDGKAIHSHTVNWDCEDAGSILELMWQWTSFSKLPDSPLL